MYTVIIELIAHATIEHAASLFIVIQLGWAGGAVCLHGVSVVGRKAKAVAPVIAPAIRKVVPRRRGPIPDQKAAD